MEQVLGRLNYGRAHFEREIAGEMGPLSKVIGCKQYDNQRELKLFVLGYPPSFRDLITRLASLTRESQFPLLLVHTYLPKTKAETEANQQAVKFLTGHEALPFRPLEDIVTILEHQ